MQQLLEDLIGEFPYHTAVYTHSADLHEVELLLKAFPDVAFQYWRTPILVLA